jgi:hypothetical protein
MTDIWTERELEVENQHFDREEQEKAEREREEFIRACCKNRCPKCGETILSVSFREVPLDICPDCGGIWLGARDLEILAEKDHRTWFEKWFRG